MSYIDVVREHVSEAAAANIAAWLTQGKYAEYKSELEQLIEAEAWQKLEDSFFKVIEFGTAGRRGATGIGSNRINKVTIGESTLALCEYAKSIDISAPDKGVVIACDTRLSSPELSRYAAQVAAASGFKTYFFESFRATPELSFAVRHLGAAVGIVISASHNPPIDNGFKAYWSDGGQISSPHDKGVLAVAETLEEIKVVSYNEAIVSGKLIIIGEEIDQAYIQAVLDQQEGTERDVKIVYSPLHGAGQTNVLPVLREAGFSQISPVEAQMVPDGNFPDVPNHKPNPEEKAANDMAVEQLLREKAEIAITHDPDADRLGIMVRQGDGVVYLSGNQTAVLAADYVLKKRLASDKLKADDYLAKTIVTTDMLAALTDHYGVKLYTNMLIGYKYIARLILEKEALGQKFIMGAEESFGLLKGDYARDKDGASGALPIAEYAAELKKEGKTLYDRLLDLYVEHGLYVEFLANAYFEGAAGFNKMQKVMTDLRANPPHEISGQPVTAVLDYQSLTRRDVSTGEETGIDCMTGNVVVLELGGDYRCRVTVRPSGTEPKLKFYIQWFEPVKDVNSVRTQYEAVTERLGIMARDLETLVLQ
jgi:phosphoglucomutase/phosphomannomutase